MDRIKSYIFTILSAVSFIYGSVLLAQHSDCLSHPSPGTLLLPFIGAAIIIVNYAMVNLLIKFVHPDSTFFHRVVFSAIVFLFIFIGTRLAVLNSFRQSDDLFTVENMAFCFGIYLVIFGISFLHFLLKK